jgi:hypothetical protein
LTDQELLDLHGEMLLSSDRDPFRVEAGPESDRIQEVVLAVREVLGHNPRRIKTFFNLYRLSLYIASAQGLLDIEHASGMSEITPEQLGAFIALTAQYPEMIADKANPAKLLKELSRYSRRSYDLGSPTKVAVFNYWLGKPGLSSLLKQEAYSLSDFPVLKFLSILPAVPVPPERVRTVDDGPPREESIASRATKAPQVEGFRVKGTGPIWSNALIDVQNTF